MIVRMGLLRKKVGLSRAAFRKHWIEVHGPIAAKLPGLRKYHQNHVIEPADHVSGDARETDLIDGFSELWFDDVEAMLHAVSSPACKPLAEDEPNLLEGLRLIVAEQNVVATAPVHVDPVKVMSLHRRSPGIGSDRFRAEWAGEHAAIVARLPRLVGYTQNFIIDRGLQRGRPATYAELPIDGISELWFDDQAAIAAAFSGAAMREAAETAKSFISESTVYDVFVHRVI